MTWSTASNERPLRVLLRSAKHRPGPSPTGQQQNLQRAWTNFRTWRILLKNSIFAADQNFPAPWSWHYKNDAGDTSRLDE
jgi:hypothetical protein